MYRGYQVKSSTLSDLFLTSTVNWQGEEAAFRENIESIQSQVNIDFSERANIEDDDGNIDAEQIVKAWFPVQEYDVFLSHSHADVETAIQFAVWLKKYLGLKVFVDSTVWGCADELLAQLDKKYCYKQNTGTYDYDKRNKTTAHVHLMLAMALQEMINKSECFLFVDSGNSIDLSWRQAQETKSPWIFEELKTTSIIEKIRPSRIVLREGLEHRDSTHVFAQKDLDVYYPVGSELSKLTRLTYEDLKNAQMDHQNNPNMHGLDTLYNQTPLKIDSHFSRGFQTR